MSRPNPSDFPALFAATFSSGDRDAVLALYMSDAVLVDQHGAEHRGHEAIGKLLQPALTSRATMIIAPQSMVEYCNLAVLRNYFEIKLGSQVLTKSTSFEVLSFDNGSWKLAVDCPCG
jgi:ketosteroid isomerase-like protein